MKIVLDLAQSEAELLVEQLDEYADEVYKTDYYMSQLGWENEAISQLLWRIVGVIKTVLAYENKKKGESDER